VTGVVELPPVREGNQEQGHVTFETALRSIRSCSPTRRPIHCQRSEQVEDLMKKGNGVAGTNSVRLPALARPVKAGAPRARHQQIDAYRPSYWHPSRSAFSRLQRFAYPGRHHKLGIGEQMKSKIKLTGGVPSPNIWPRATSSLASSRPTCRSHSGTDYVGRYGLRQQACPFNVA